MIGGLQMSFLEIFKGKKYKAELEKLQQEHEALKALMTPEMQDAMAIKKEISRLQEEQRTVQSSLDTLLRTIDSKNNDISSLEQTIENKKNQIVWLDDEILVQEFGLYSPKFDFANALRYKEALSEIRAAQKELIKNNKAVTGNTAWTVNNNATKGKKMVTGHPETSPPCF